MPHIHEKIDFTVDVFIVFQDKVLIRKHDKYKKWLAVGGHVELHETTDVAALREVKEEVGLDVELVSPRDLPVYDSLENNQTELTPPWYMNIHKINETHKHLSLVYFAKTYNNNVIPENINDEWRWFTRDELKDEKFDLIESVRFYATKALEELGY